MSKNRRIIGSHTRITKSLSPEEVRTVIALKIAAARQNAIFKFGEPTESGIPTIVERDATERDRELKKVKKMQEYYNKKYLYAD